VETARKMREVMENEIASEMKSLSKWSDPPLKTSSTQGAMTRHRLSRIATPTKENDSDHLASKWIRSDRTKVDHYRIGHPQGRLDSAALLFAML